MASTQPDVSFNSVYETTALNFLFQYDMGQYVRNIELEYDIINGNITNIEVTRAIDYLKNNMSPGRDSIPTELSKPVNWRYVPKSASYWITSFDCRIFLNYGQTCCELRYSNLGVDLIMTAIVV